MSACRRCGLPNASSRATCEACVSAISDLYRRIASVTCAFDFAEPLEQADFDIFHGHLVARLPPTHAVELQYDRRWNAVEVTIRDEHGRTYYNRRMLVVPLHRKF